MMAWTVAGNVLIACNCDYGCPCNFNALPSRGNCEGGWIWIVDKGHVDDVSLDGLGIALFAKWPGAIHHGGGRAVCYVDERATDAQRNALAVLLRGELGGPWGLFIKTYALADPVMARFDVRLADYGTRVSIGDAVALELETIRNPVTQAEVHPEVVLPEGLITKRGSMAASKVFRVGSGLEYDHSGQYAAFGRFEYA
ncbi:MAG: DUF1326 domain-containing protein [Vicinamibacterales bacterium]